MILSIKYIKIKKKLRYLHLNFQGVALKRVQTAVPINDEVSKKQHGETNNPGILKNKR